MKIKPFHHTDRKDGAALIIALSFLAILTIIIIAFAARTRTERLSGRAYLSSAQTRHLLNTALSRALEDIDAGVGTNYPGFTPLTPQNAPDGVLLKDSLNFTLEEAYFQTGNRSINQSYQDTLERAAWQTITANNNPIGRIGYIIINSSGLLDANHAGGETGDGSLIERKAGLSPAEIQLGLTANTPEAFIHNRENDWRRFETLRDLAVLKNLGKRTPTLGSITNFSTFSFSPPTDSRTFMGNNSDTLNFDLIADELDKIPAIPDPDFVLNQLRDYLDTDTIPEDENGEYTDFSVEPTPLINELVLTCDFSFTPLINEDDDDAGNIVSNITVSVTNSYSLDLEVWYPFVGFRNPDTYTVHIADPPIESGTLPVELFGIVTDWTDDHVIPADEITPGSPPYNYPVYDDTLNTETEDEDDLVLLFEEMQSNIEFPSIYCDNDAGERVDVVEHLDLPLDDEIPDLVDRIRELAADLFDPESGIEITNLTFTIGRAAIDPRLNWDGSTLDQWVEVGDNGYGDTLGDINSEAIAGTVVTPDPTDIAFVRNTDRIDTPYEFTYLLYDTAQPWKTFQFIEENDDDDTRFVIQNLSPYPNGPPRYGRINPYSPHTNVIASAFMNMPMDEFNTPETLRMDADMAAEAARLFMKHLEENGWSTNASRYGSGIAFAELQNVTGGTENPWIAESFFRNSYELFNPRDTLYTIILAAQKGIDRDSNGIIADDEVQATQKAVVYVWRDPVTEKCACVFFGLSDTLQSSLTGQSWSAVLQAFKP